MIPHKNKGYKWSPDFFEALLAWNFLTFFLFFFYLVAYRKLVDVYCALLIIFFCLVFLPTYIRKTLIFFSLDFHLGNYFWWLSPLYAMYQSISETRHPLQSEEQEVGIDPLSSYSHKSGGKFCVQMLFAYAGNSTAGLSKFCSCYRYHPFYEANQKILLGMYRIFLMLMNIRNSSLVLKIECTLANVIFLTVPLVYTFF